MPQRPRLLLAEDHPDVRRTTTLLLEELGYDVAQASDGVEALAALVEPDGPTLALLDWNMPRMDGLEVCRRLRAEPPAAPRHLVLLTMRTSAEEIAAGLDAGADDYVTKPFEVAELRARLDVGRRLSEARASLARRVAELQDALAHVKTLQGLLPMCMHCHKIRDEQQVWQRLEKYLHEHTEARLSHGLCPDCLREHYPEYADGAAGPPTGRTP